MFYLIRFAGVKLSIHAQSQAAAMLVESAIEAMDFRKNREIDFSESRFSDFIQLTLGGDQDQWVLSDPVGEVNLTLKQEGDAVYHLTDRIVFHVADKSTGVHCLHAAAVADSGRAMVIPADSGSGKSTFTAWLVANGFDYLSDELILVGDNGELDAIARPIQIKSKGLLPVLPLITKPDTIAMGVYANAIPISSLGGKSVSKSPKLSMFVFPKYNSESAFNLVKLSSADAGMRLMANHVNARNLEGHGFRSMMKLIRNTPCYSLDYGGFDTLPDDFSSRFKELLARNLSGSLA